ncbi:MAG: hypothetical protein WC135_03770 [Bacteroidales bacterium]
MKKNTIFIISSLLLISTFGIFGCVPKIEDDDMITGKWIDTLILMDTLSTQCQKKSYIEFSEYELDLKDRIHEKYHACPGVEEYEAEDGETATRTTPPFTERIGNYSIKGDTLIVKDIENQTLIYVIGSIDSENMTLKDLDRDGNIRIKFYKRFKD